MKDRDIGTVTGKVYDLSAGDKIDPSSEGIGLSGEKSSPHPIVAGRKMYKRIFIRRKRPEKIFSEMNLQDKESLERSIRAIVTWFQDFADCDVELTFDVKPIIKK